MALALNTSHPLYGNLITLVGVDDDSVIKDFTGGSTCTTDAAVVVGTGTYGRHFRTTIVSNNAQGVALSPGFQPKPTATPVGTTFIVFNAGNSSVSRGQVLNTSASSNKIGLAVYTSKNAWLMGTGTPSVFGVVTLIGTGAHSIALGVNGTTAWKLATDGVNDTTGTSNIGNASADYDSYIGGGPTGGYGGFAADYVWVAHFNKYLSDAEILDLHNSLGASNAFGLIASSGDTTVPTLTGSPTVGVVTSSSIQISWAAGSDNIAVTSYETSPDGTTWTDCGNVLTYTFSGLSASTSYTLRVRAKDAAANVSTPAISVTQSTSAVIYPGITTPVLKNNTGTVLASETGVVVNVYNNSTGALVLQKTGLVSTTSGIVTFTDGALSAATSYAYEVVLSGGRRRLPLVTTT
jgi:hypothetical protein